MADFGVGDRLLAGAHAVEEIGHVIAAGFQAEGVVGEGCGNDVFLMSGEIAAGYPDPALGAFKPEAIALALLIGDSAEDRVVGGGFDVVGDAVVVGEGDVVCAGSGVTTGDGLGKDFALDSDGPGAIDRPAGDVIMMGAPIGHGPAGIIEPEPEVGMGALTNVIDLGRLTEIEIPIEPGGNG